MIDTPGYLAVRDVVEILGIGSGSIDIVDIAVSWVVELIGSVRGLACMVW